MKFSLHKLYKSVLVGVASFALVVPLGMSNGNTVSASEHHSLKYYATCLIDSDYDYHYDTPDSQLSLIVKHPALRHTYDAKLCMEYANVHWGYYGWDYYAHHYAQIYSPYLRHVMPTHVENAYCSQRRVNHMNRLIRKGEQKVGILKRSHKTHRHVRHHAKRHIRKHIRRNRKHAKHGRRYRVIPIND